MNVLMSVNVPLIVLGACALTFILFVRELVQWFRLVLWRNNGNTRDLLLMKESKVGEVATKNEDLPKDFKGFHCDDNNICKLNNVTPDTSINQLFGFSTPEELDFFKSCPQLVGAIGPPIEYEDLAKEFQSFDICGVKGYQFFGNNIQVIQNKFRGCSPITHISTLIREDVYQGKGMTENKDPVKVYESVIGGNRLPGGLDTVKNIEDEAENGPQIRSLREQLLAPENEKSIFVWCALRPEIRAKLQANFAMGDTPFNDPFSNI